MYFLVFCLDIFHKLYVFLRKCKFIYARSRAVCIIFFLNVLILCINILLIKNPTFVLQILNLTQALKDGKSPVQLVQMPVVTVECNRSRSGRTRSDNEIFTQSFSHRAPFFSWCWGRCFKLPVYKVFIFLSHKLQSLHFMEQYLKSFTSWGHW